MQWRLEFLLDRVLRGLQREGHLLCWHWANKNGPMDRCLRSDFVVCFPSRVSLFMQARVVTERSNRSRVRRRIRQMLAHAPHAPLIFVQRPENVPDEDDRGPRYDFFVARVRRLIAIAIESSEFPRVKDQAAIATYVERLVDIAFDEGVSHNNSDDVLFRLVYARAAAEEAPPRPA